MYQNFKKHVQSIAFRRCRYCRRYCCLSSRLSLIDSQRYSTRAESARDGSLGLNEFRFSRYKETEKETKTRRTKTYANGGIPCSVVGGTKLSGKLFYYFAVFITWVQVKLSFMKQYLKELS